MPTLSTDGLPRAEAVLSRFAPVEGTSVAGFCWWKCGPEGDVADVAAAELEDALGGASRDSTEADVTVFCKPSAKDTESIRCPK